MSHLLDHPEIAGAPLPAGVLVVAPNGDSRRLYGGDATSDRPDQLEVRGHIASENDTVTAAWTAGYAYEVGAPFQRAMVLGYALARLSPVPETVSYRLVYLESGDADVEALDAEGSILATWCVSSGSSGTPTSVSKR